jgi:hypothetical protein
MNLILKSNDYGEELDKTIEQAKANHWQHIPQIKSYNTASHPKRQVNQSPITQGQRLVRYSSKDPLPLRQIKLKASDLLDVILEIKEEQPKLKPKKSTQEFNIAINKIKEAMFWVESILRV